jgi:hypothetical protein
MMSMSGSAIRGLISPAGRRVNRQATRTATARGPPPLPWRARVDYCCPHPAHHVAAKRHRRTTVEAHGTFGTIWASLGMTAYYMALIWINILLGLFLGPLFMIPVTWLQDRMKKA